jgi:outer membrane biosynthesis protein TonB
MESIEETLPPEPVPPPPSETSPEISEEPPPVKDIKPAPVPPQKPDLPRKVVEKPKDKPDKDRPSLDSVLKNLVPEEMPEPQPVEKTEPAAGTSGRSLSENILSMSEIDAVRAQISKCWNFNYGAKYAEELVVQVRLVMRPNRTVQSAKIIDQGRFNRDSTFRAAAESALRAVRNPDCSPLDLPPDKYEEWKYITLNFDPSQML